MSRPTFDRFDLAAIAIGGIVGATLRWLVIRTEEPEGHWFTYEGQPADLLLELNFPLRTLLVNLIGCVLLGGLTVMLSRAQGASRRVLVAAATGFCGSLTTFSTFAVEIAERLRGLPAVTSRADVGPFDVGPELGAALTYLVISVVGGAIAFWLGRACTTQVTTSRGQSAAGGEQ